MFRTNFFLLFGLLGILASGFSQSYVPETHQPKTLVKPTIALQAHPFNLSQVKLLEGSDFKRAMDNTATYLKSLEPDRLLHRFHANAGLPTKGEVYGGWESEGLSGHTLGHYLSACAMMYAGSGDKDLKTRTDYLVDQLEACQKARKTGYIGAIPREDSIFGLVSKGIIKSSGFDLNGGWSPWYTVHKVMSGLVDAHLYTDNKKALQLATRMADWTYNTINHLPDSTLQQMLKCEYGGMNDVLAQIYALTGNKKYLDLSFKFYDNFVMQPLSEKKDPMPGKHSNTNVPKAIGSATQYELTGQEREKTIASFFWETMVHNHSYVIGGNSSYEYCGEPGKLNDRLSDNTCETCNTYNMLKLTRHLFCWEPDSRYSDYYERALYNHILASQNPADGMMCYFVPLRMGTKKTFSDRFNTFTCCVGSGMENHSRYTEGIYYHSPDEERIFVNLFIPSQLHWKKKKVQLIQETNFPYGNATTFTVKTKGKKDFELWIRHPWWAHQELQIQVNGASVPAVKNENGYVVIQRQWQNKDQVRVIFPMEIYQESLPDNPNRVAFLYGPVVLAGQLGATLPDPVYGIPVLLTSDRNPKLWVQPMEDSPLSFKMNKVGEPFDAALKPFFNTVDQHYTVYWDYFTPAEWTEKKKEYEAEKAAQKEIERRTIDHFRVGEMQPERDHGLEATERSYVSDALGINGREARRDHHFSFTMKVDPASNNELLCVYIGDDKNRIFDILVDGKPFQTVKWEGGTANKFYNRVYPLPSDLIKGKSSIRIQILANAGTTTARIFGVRTLRE